MTITTAAHEMTDSADLPGFVWTNAGAHAGETLEQIVARKMGDIQRFGWCLWAYAGGGGPAHPETQVRALAQNLRVDSLPVLMPTTGRVDPTGAAFCAYSQFRNGRLERLPEGMSPVTGSRGAWALMLDSLEWVDLILDLAAFEAPFATGGAQPLVKYLRGSHGRACALRSVTPGAANDRRITLTARTRAPHAVYLRD
jgi:hypothetical protein